LTMALSLVEGMTEDWNPAQYRDTYKEDVMALVKKKIKAGQTKTITAPEPESKEPRSSNVVDLVALLQSSLGKKAGKAPAKAAPAEDDEEDTEAEAKPAPRKRAAAKAKPATATATAAKAKPKAKPAGTRAKTATARKAA